MTDQVQAPLKPKKSGVWVFALPLAIFLGLSGLFFTQLISGKDTSHVPSALVGKTVPEFDLPMLEGAFQDGKQLPGFATADTKGSPVTLVNVWASWCIPCRAEHPFVKQLGKDPNITLYGLNHKDSPQSAVAFLEELGNPYDAIGVDANGRTSIDFGVYGVPETFVIDSDGIIRHKFIGPITSSRLQSELLPAIRAVLDETS